MQDSESPQNRKYRRLLSWIMCMIFAVIIVPLLAVATIPVVRASVNDSLDDPCTPLLCYLLWGQATYESAALQHIDDDPDGRIFAVQGRIRTFTTCSQGPRPDEFHEQIMHLRTNTMARGLFALSSIESTIEEACAVAREIPLSFEWEGMMEPPLRESEAAAAFLARNPDTPFRPFLLLFIIHHSRCSLSLWQESDDVSRKVRAEKLYKTACDSALHSKDPLLTRLAVITDLMPCFCELPEEPAAPAKKAKNETEIQKK